MYSNMYKQQLKQKRGNRFDYFSFHREFSNLLKQNERKKDMNNKSTRKSCSLHINIFSCCFGLITIKDEFNSEDSIRERERERSLSLSQSQNLERIYLKASVCCFCSCSFYNCWAEKGSEFCVFNWCYHNSPSIFSFFFYGSFLSLASKFSAFTPCHHSSSILFSPVTCTKY